MTNSLSRRRLLWVHGLAKSAMPSMISVFIANDINRMRDMRRMRVWRGSPLRAGAVRASVRAYSSSYRLDAWKWTTLGRLETGLSEERLSKSDEGSVRSAVRHVVRWSPGNRAWPLVNVFEGIA
jgi:hypothetical protein